MSTTRTISSTAKPVTDPQQYYLRKLIRDRVLTDWPAESDRRLVMLERLFETGMTRLAASTMITQLQDAPVDPAAPSAESRAQTAATQPATAPFKPARIGVYSLNDELYIVKPNRTKTRLYAMRLIELTRSAQRMTESGDVVTFEYVYAPQVVNVLTDEHRLTVDDVEALSIRYGRCVLCGSPLKAAKSVKRGIGPVCRKKVLG